MKWMRRLRPVWLLATLVFGALACNLPGANSPTAIPVSTEAAGGLVATLTSITPGPGGETTITLTQEQLTSYVALELQKTPDVPFTDPQIILTEGKLKMTGNLDLNGVNAPCEMEMEVAVSPDGGPDVNVLSAKFGPLEMPSDVLQSLSDVVAKGLSKQMNDQAGGDLQLQSLTIGDGTLTATGILAQ
jgi:hypothetical protein